MSIHQYQLTNCDKEPIHLLSRIQQSGILIVIGYDFKIVQISDNCFKLLNYLPNELINKPINSIFDESFIDKLDSQIKSSQNQQLPLTIETSYLDKTLFCIVHLEKDYIIVEINEIKNSLEFVIKSEQIVSKAVEQCKATLDFNVLMQNIVDTVQDISGYDRVLLYKFDEDNHGTVLATATRNFEDDFLFHRFPASDIPVQARMLYINNKFRIIENVDEDNSFLTPSRNSINNDFLDMSNCYLRGVSPIHIEYLKNMNVKSSMSISIVIDGKLWGLIACHHTTPNKLHLFLYKSFYLLSDIFSFQIEQKELFEKYEERLKGQLRREFFFNLLNSKTDSAFFDAFQTEIDIFNSIISSDECVVFENDKIKCKNSSLLNNEIKKIKNFVLQNIEKNIYATSQLGLVYPEVNDFTKVIGGILFAQIPIKENIIYIMFLRNELIHDIYWAGNPNKQVEYINGQVVINPRASFESYKEVVRGSSKSFSSVEFESLKSVIKKIKNSWKIFDSLKEVREIKEEQKFIEEQKLHSMIELINNISHQWRQPLSIISTISSGIIFQKELNVLNTDRLVDDMNFIIKQTQYLSKTIDYFSDFLQSTTFNTDFSVINAIKKAISFLEPSLVGISLVANFEDDIVILGYENEFIQSIINILYNSIDAVNKNEEKLIFVNTSIKDGAYIIEILDNGGGIPIEIIRRIFEPYFTTKHQSIGTGLGLSFTYNILTRYHNATFKVENKSFKVGNNIYKGTCFQILIARKEKVIKNSFDIDFDKMAF